MATHAQSPPSLEHRKRWTAGLDSPPVRLEIVNVEKRKGISNYYLYIITVTRTNRTQYTISRRYRQFHEMQQHLEQRFPIEAGSISARDRTLPNLPGKIFLGRSAIREVTDKRLPQLNGYLKKLFELPDNIRYDSIVMAFVRPTEEDKKTHSRKQAYRKANDVVPRPGGRPDKPPRPSVPPPVPPSHLKKKPAPPPRPAPPPKPKPAGIRGPRAKMLYAYTGQYSDELTVSAGTMIALVRCVDTEWYEARVNGHTGLVPGNYLNIIEPPVTRDTRDEIQDSDEWDDDSEGEKGKMTYYFNGAARTLEVDADLIDDPTLLGLRKAIQDHLSQQNIVLNYRDSTGDLIEMVDQEDISLMRSEGIPPRRQSDSSHAPWAVYVTKEGDYTPYNTDPYKR